MKNKLIPKSFELGGHKWSIKLDNNIDYESAAAGNCDYWNQTIKLADSISNKKINEEQLENTFYHELVHAILMTMDERDLNKNEKFVEQFSVFLHQFMKTKK